ncbi:MAG: putative C-S lyase [Halieaceae bacterium]|jgi:cysteine-S-conjugate beta-lyase|nr:putative C-S lyase [Halieaceae bacterium]
MSTANHQKIDFDSIPERRGGDSHKWNRFASGSQDVIGAWVADMDFPAPDPVLDAIRQRLDGPAMGYSEPPLELIIVMLERLQKLYNWRVDPSWLVALPGVLPGLYGATRAVGDPGDAIITQSPNYHHFYGAANYSERQPLGLKHRLSNGRWEMDLDHLNHLATSGARSFLLCNPHNPLGRILPQAELEAAAQACLNNDIVICADEIHADLLLDTDKKHIPIASLSTEIEQNSITLLSPSKAFNLAGVGGFALAIVPNPDLRGALERQLHGMAVHPGALTYAAALAAYRDCDSWLAQLQQYLRGNRDYLEQQIAAIDGLSMAHVEATFLAWINISELQLDKPFEHFLAHGVALSDGADMGDGNYLRLNFGCTRTTLEEMLSRITTAVNKCT